MKVAWIRRVRLQRYRLTDAGKPLRARRDADR